MTPKVEPTVEQCGFCGRFFKGETYLDDFKPSGNIPIGYCPEAGYEDPDHQPERRVTRDMAIDAGMPELEGSIL